MRFRCPELRAAIVVGDDPQSDGSKEAKDDNDEGYYDGCIGFAAKNDAEPAQFLAAQFQVMFL